VRERAAGYTSAVLAGRPSVAAEGNVEGILDGARPCQALPRLPPPGRRSERTGTLAGPPPRTSLPSPCLRPRHVPRARMSLKPQRPRGRYLAVMGFIGSLHWVPTLGPGTGGLALGA